MTRNSLSQGTRPRPAAGKKKKWRVGSKIRLNVYDERGKPVCQPHTPEMAALIVRAVNKLLWPEEKK